jgi:segregation and condensation protein B
VLTPTRELAIQIDESFNAYGKGLKLKHAVIFGGVAQNPQVNVLRAGIDILIATPGRLLDLMQQKHVSLDHIEKFVLDGQQARLTQAALETLSVIAYKQPVSRARVSAIRGVNVEAVMKTLVSRGLVEEAGIEGESGAVLYKTTSFFLEKLGLNSTSDLPALAPFLPDIDGLDELLANLTE